MPRVNYQKRTKKHIQRAMALKTKLLENGLTFRDVAKELQLDEAGITKYAYGDYTGKRSKITQWVTAKFGEYFVAELDRYVA